MCNKKTVKSCNLTFLRMFFDDKMILVGSGNYFLGGGSLNVIELKRQDTLFFIFFECLELSDGDVSMLYGNMRRDSL